jgi:hypothetical protein
VCVCVFAFLGGGWGRPLTFVRTQDNFYCTQADGCITNLCTSSQTKWRDCDDCGDMKLMNSITSVMVMVAACISLSMLLSYILACCCNGGTQRSPCLIIMGVIGILVSTAASLYYGAYSPTAWEDFWNGWTQGLLLGQDCGPCDQFQGTASYGSWGPLGWYFEVLLSGALLLLTLLSAYQP